MTPPTREDIDKAVAQLTREMASPEFAAALDRVLDMVETCATCGESLVGPDVAEVVRDGKHVLVHANTCMLEGDEVA